MPNKIKRSSEPSTNVALPIENSLNANIIYASFHENKKIKLKINCHNLPVAPVKRVLINSFLFVKFVSHDAHEYNLMPLI